MTRTPRMRPRFEVPLDPDGPEFFDALRHHLARPDCRLEGQVVPGHATISRPRMARSLLSPVLNLELAERDGAPVLVGRFSPDGNVWTGFMFIYAVLAMVGVCGLVYGLAELPVDGPGWSLLIAPVCLALIAFVYGAAVIGQGLTADEMYELRALVDRVLARTDPSSDP